MGGIMGSQRAHVILPHELIEEIDLVVGPRGRSAFLVETATAELRRRRLLAFLQNEEPAWIEKNHSELARGVGAWVKGLRAEGEGRLLRGRQKGKKTK